MMRRSRNAIRSTGVGVWACLAVLALPIGGARADFYGADAAFGPGSGGQPTLTTQAALAFEQAQAGNAFRSIDFSSVTPSSPSTSANNVLTTLGRPSDGLQYITQNLSYSPPLGYQFGVTNSANTDTVNNSANVGYNLLFSASNGQAPTFSVGGFRHFAFAGDLPSGATTPTTASFTLASQIGFQSVGVFLTGLGNTGGTATLRLDNGPAVTIRGTSQGGLLFYGYVGTAMAHSLTITSTNPSTTVRDAFGISGIMLVTTVVPEPSSFGLTAAGLLGFAWTGLRRRRPA